MLPANLNSLSDINSQFVINLFPTDFNTQLVQSPVSTELFIATQE